MNKYRMLLMLLVIAWGTPGWPEPLRDAEVALQQGHPEVAGQLLQPLVAAQDAQALALSARIEQALREKQAESPDADQLRLPAKPGAQPPALEAPMETATAGASVTPPDQPLPLRCLSEEQLYQLVNEARNAAAQESLKKAEAVAAANRIRQQRAVDRMRAQVEQEAEARVRRKLESAFEQRLEERLVAMARDTAPRVATGVLDAPPPAMDKPAWQGDITALRTHAADSDPQAQFLLGERYFRGEQTPVDYAKAYHWWREAARNGSQDALAGLDVLLPRLLPEQLALEE